MKRAKPAKLAAYDAQITQVQYASFQQAFDFFNRELFDRSLPQLLVTLQRHGGMNGYFSPERFSGRTNGAVTHELALNPDHFTKRSDEEILSTLVHEMVHQWQHVHGRVPRRGYHDKRWGAKMKEIGLHPSNTGQPGGKETGGRMSHYIIAGGRYALAYAKLAKTGLKLDWQSKPPERKQRNSKTKFTCSSCGQNVWGAPDVQVDCHKCGVLMTSANAAYATNAAD